MAPRVLFIAGCYKDRPCLEVPDPLRLSEFYPCPRPMYAISQSNSLVPVPLYRLYKEQAEELDRVSARINKIVGAMKGIVLAYLPGMEGGTAIARVLFGDANPCGKLPRFSYPRFPNSIVPYDHKPLEIADVNRYDPQWAFGFGLSYTTFAYSDLAISRDRVPRGGTVDVSVTVKNTLHLSIFGPKEPNGET